MRNYTIELKWAFIFIAMMLGWMVMERLIGLHDTRIELHPIITNFVAIPAILIYVLALRDKRKNFYNGEMSYKMGFMSGLVITAIVTLFTPLTQYLTLTVITPDFFKNMIAYSVSHGHSTQQEAETYFNMRNYIIQSVIFTPIMGIITTGIVAVFFKTKRK